MKVWAITFQEFGGAEEVVHDTRLADSGHLIYADSLYSKAVEAFLSVVADRIGKSHATYQYDGQLGPDAHLTIIARQHDEHEECCGYSGDIIRLRPYDVIGA